MCQTIAPGDSAELITNAFQLGLVHPPGYPLYTLIANLFTRIPYGSVAWRVNLFSVISMALSVSFLFCTVNLLIRRLFVSLLFALIYGFSTLVWQYALVAEVFALNQLLLSIFLYVTIRLSITKSYRYFYMMSLVTGLALTHHHTFLFVGGPLLIWAILRLKRDLNISIFVKAGALLIVGLSPYLMLIIFGNQATILSWGSIDEPADFFRHILRKEYGTFSLGPQFDGNYFIKNLLEFILTILKESLFILLPLFFLATWNKLKYFKWKIVFAWLIMSLFGYLIIFHYLAKINIDDPIYLSVMQRFWLLPYLLLFVLAAPSIRFISKKEFIHKKLRLIAPILIFLALVLVQLVTNFQKNDQSRNFLFRDFAKSLLTNVDQNGILLAFGDLDVYSAAYMQICEGFRPDVKIVSQTRFSTSWYSNILTQVYPDLNSQLQEVPVSQRISAFILANSSRYPIFTGAENSTMDSKDWRRYFYELPVGFTNKLVPVGSIPSSMEYFQKYGSDLNNYAWMNSALKQDSAWARHIVQRFYNSEYRRFDFVMQNYTKLDANQKSDLKSRLDFLINYYGTEPKLIAWRSKLQIGE